ncbi:MAG: hypothetical protein F6J96_15405 [Symploca sp. SIO1C2]|nr:hypothetical protein [Symploca sp. SIO1C2]
MPNYPKPLAFVTGLCIIAASCLHTAPAFSCACCASQNTWRREERKPYEYEYSQISGIASLEGWLIEDNGGRGPIYLEREVRTVGKKQSSGVWRFSVESLGVMTFTSNSQWQFFETFAGELTGVYKDSVELYKEIVIPGTIRVEGPLATILGNEQISARLILKGQGNNCLSRDDFRWWLFQFSIGESIDEINFVGLGEVLLEE